MPSALGVRGRRASADCGDKAAGRGLGFHYDDGRPLNPYYISDVFRRLVRAGRAAASDLPRSQGTSTLRCCCPQRADHRRSKRLCHASAAITSDLYSHLLDDADRRMADAVETVLGASVAAAHTSHTPRPQRQQKGLTSQPEKLF